jgi:LmbE family N-acetylglucosaminyl deacetylase
MVYKHTRSILVLTLLAAMLAPGPIVRGQVRAIYDTGAAGLGLKLKRLQTTASMMHTGAHPDDEDSGLIARTARGDSARVSYLSLTRGEGGQNVIGPELFESLGVIRTEELLQARRLDGGQQFFTRFMEYGFSKRREEAARIWDDKKVLGDMVRAIRLFRPLVITSRFSGTPADGHGQHQLAGYLTPIAYKAAADPNQYPEHLQEGLRPWQAKKLYVGQGFAANAANPPSVVVPTGEYDPLIGRSYFEIAMEGRSQHKSQEMGSLELRGKQQSGLRFLDGTKVENEKGIFDGVDTSITGIAKLAGVTDGSLDADLSAIQTSAAKALEDFDALDPRKSIAPLANGLQAVKSARQKLSGKNDNASKEADYFLKHKEKEFSDALLAAAGVIVDALADTETVIPGDSTNVAVRVFAPEVSGVTVSGSSIKAQDGWTAVAQPEPAQPAATGFRPRNEVSLGANFFKLTAPADAKPTQPYWLENDRTNFTFDWSNAGMDKNMPFQKPIATAEVKLNIGGTEVTTWKTVEYRFADDIRGELRRDLNVVPAVTITLDSNLIIAPVATAATKKRVVASVTNNVPRETKGTVKLQVPSGWTASPASSDFALKNKGEKTAVVFDISIPANTKADSYNIPAVAQVGNSTYGLTTLEVAYPHMQTHRRYTQAAVAAKVIDVKVAPVRVGYVMGTGDRVPEAIALLGLPVTLLDERDLSTGDLSKFDTIVIGIRASQVRPDYVSNNGRLLDFVRNGGTMIVQYQQQEFIRENLAPFPVKMEAFVNGQQRIGNIRVVDENAPVTILVPNHVTMNVPNRIGASDWDNWVQERNLYSLSGLDPQYTALLSTADEGEPPVTGALVHVKLGKGHWVYNSYSFFRQLPAGNPGAFRLFANLLSLPQSDL